MTPGEAISTSAPRDAIRWLTAAYLFVVVAGVGTVMLGPLLPTLIVRWQIQDAQAGSLFAASFAGQFCGACIGARNLRASILYGSALSALSFISLASAGLGAAHLALFCIGFGIGAGLTAGNIVAGTIVPAARTRLLAVLGVAWGLGAIASPLLVKLCGAGGSRRFFYVVALCFGVTTLVALAIPLQGRSAPASSGSENFRSTLPFSLLQLIAFGSAILLYVGIENALGGWLPSYAVRSGLSMPSASISLCFWVAVLCGRLLLPVLLLVASETVLYEACLVLLILIEILLSTIKQPSGFWLVGLVVLAGLTLAPLFPLILSFLLARTGRNARLGPLFASASLGGAVLPWLTGLLSTQRHSLRVGLLVPTVGAVCLLALSTIVKADPAEQGGFNPGHFQP